jgi:hypothetical protein
MKKAARKVIVSVVVLVIALSLAITSTYAWFTMSSDPVVDGFDINVTTSNGLLIRLQGKKSVVPEGGEQPVLTPYQGNLKSRISKEEIMAYLFGDDDAEKYTYYPGKYGTDFALSACTSQDGRTIAAGHSNELDYIEMELYFFSNVKQVVKLNSENGLTEVTSTPGTKKNGEAWAAISADTYGDHDDYDKGDEIQADAANAARISFDNGTDVVIWNPNPEKGFNKCSNYLGEPEFTAANMAVDYYNNTANPESEITVPGWYTGVTPNYSTNYGSGNYIIADELLTLSEVIDEDEEIIGYAGTLTIRIWLEGWDGDCFDSIFEDVLNVYLQFAGSEVETESEGN